MEALFLIVIFSVYGLLWLIGGMIAIIFNPVFWIVYLLLSNGNCGCDRR